MRTIKYNLWGTVVSMLLLSACNNMYLERYPETSISQEKFFETLADLETYTNGLYNQLQYRREDVFSDNISYHLAAEADQLVRGQITPQNVSGWSKATWGNLRQINFLLDNTGRVSATKEEVNHYIGIAKFFRAWFYFDMIKRYGMAPWYSHVIDQGDQAALMKGQDSRTLIVDSIMQDLDFAVRYVEPGSSRTRITRYAALALQARIALFEGTFRKYHPELNLQSTADVFLRKAVEASEQIMQKTDQYDITGSGKEGYAVLFAGALNNNKEAILFVDFDRQLGKLNANSEVLDRSWNLSKSLADSYLKTDGTPATSDPDYATRGYAEMFEDRDPRMSVTIMPPGYVMAAETAPHITNPSYGAIPQVKYYTNDPAFNPGGYNTFSTDYPVFRLAEILLINAEAKAELGTLTETDLVETVNKIRDRVQMPHLSMSVPLDPVLEKQYPAVTGNLKNVILEIRRERRVELACEGLRYDDLLRWGAGNLLEEPAEGIYVPALGGIDVTGDGVPDVAILKSETETGPIDHLPQEVKDKLAKYYLYDKNGEKGSIYLSEGDKGTIRFKNDVEQPRKFVAPKYYYFPIPFDQVRDNPNLKQPMGWE